MGHNEKLSFFMLLKELIWVRFKGASWTWSIKCIAIPLGVDPARLIL